MASNPSRSGKDIPRVAIIGGGIAGLAAAYRLRELAAARETPILTTVLEREERAGGSLSTIRRDGFVIETGADSMLTEKPWGLDLVRRVGLEPELIPTREEFRKTYVVRAGRLVEIPAGFTLLAPTRVGPILRSPLFSPLAKLRMGLEMFIPARRGDEDESLGSFVRRRFGREVLERVAQPLAGGIYTADPEKLSLKATMPRFLEMERRYGSVIRGMRAAESARAARGPGVSGARWSLFVSFRTGMEALAEALVSRLESSVKPSAEVSALTREADGWLVELADGEKLRADAVIIAAPSHVAARLLGPIHPELADILARIEYSSAATVNLAYRNKDFPRPPDSFGFVVPVAERRKIIAGSFSSLKYEGRAPEGFILARAFLGGVLQSAMMDLSDEEMIAAARDEFRALCGVEAAPILTEVRRWPRAMPQYDVGHLERADMIDRLVSSIGGLGLAGSAYRGVGVPDCVHGAEQAAESIFARLTERA
jgi:oxygen-dependent protoporphyrinogen oxidase